MSRKSRLEAARERMYHDLVFETAEQLFADRGFDDTAVQDIATEAGISLKSLYGVFPGKNELYHEIQEVRGAEFLAHIHAEMDRGGDPLDTLALAVRAYIEFLAEHPNYLRIHLRDGRAWGLPIDGTGQEGWREGVARFATIVEEGMRSGIFYEGDPEMLALMGIAIMQVGLARLADGPAQGDRERVADEILLQLRRMLCRPEHVEERAA